MMPLIPTTASVVQLAEARMLSMSKARRELDWRAREVLLAWCAVIDAELARRSQDSRGARS